MALSVCKDLSSHSSEPSLAPFPSITNYFSLYVENKNRGNRILEETGEGEEELCQSRRVTALSWTIFGKNAHRRRAETQLLGSSEDRYFLFFHTLKGKSTGCKTRVPPTQIYKKYMNIFQLSEI